MPLLIRVRTVVLGAGAGTVVTISEDGTVLATVVESVARADADVAVSVAQPERITMTARITAVLALPVGDAVRSFPILVSIA